jgi:hypothetical protein
MNHLVPFRSAAACPALIVIEFFTAFGETIVQPSFCVGYAPQKLLLRSLALASLNLA